MTEKKNQLFGKSMCRLRHAGKQKSKVLFIQLNLRIGVTTKAVSTERKTANQKRRSTFFV